MSAVMLATRMGTSEFMVMSIMSTSSVKTRPAMGALKMPEMAAAQPQPTRSITVRLSMPKSWPKREPMAEPVSTMGASAPTEPPKPMVMAEATTDDQQLWALMRDCLVEMA